MFKTIRSGADDPLIDLETVRETLLYMRDDMRRDPATAGVARALDEALSEIDAVGTTTVGHGRTVVSRFFARSL